MKKKQTLDLDHDDLRPEYGPEFFRELNPNRFAPEQKIDKQALVTLDEDVSRVFQSSQEVNTLLRSAIRAMRTAAPKPRTLKSGGAKRRAS